MKNCCWKCNWIIFKAIERANTAIAHVLCIPRFNRLCSCQCKQGWQSCWYCIDTDCWDSARLIAKVYLCHGHDNWIKRMAEYQIAWELSGNCTNMTFHSDGATKHGCSYTTFDVINEPSKLIVCDLQEVCFLLAPDPKVNKFFEIS